MIRKLQDNPQRTALAIVGVSVWLLLTSIVAGQARSSSPEAQDIAALLADVRQLRMSVDLIATTTPQVELVAARLQIEEGRLTNLVRQLDNVNDDHGKAQKELTELLQQQQSLQAKENQAQSDTARQMANSMMRSLNREIERLRPDVQRLSASQEHLIKEIDAGQRRWRDLSAQLDEIGRELQRRQARR